jgi:hypothetical protein|tara:strand:- start:1003 stop:1431 length:429 start_codon:yes stop_codon:yes gene_type:complete
MVKTMINHKALFDTDKICEHYSKKDGVPINYVCTSTNTNHGTEAMDIFYRDTPHPKFGNRYFGLYRTPTGSMMITNADRIEKLNFGLVEDDDGNLQYSAHRWDYKRFDNGNMIDGGRSYIKSSMCQVHMHVVRDGEMVESTE